jgi:phosphoserine phosphatase
LRAGTHGAGSTRAKAADLLFVAHPDAARGVLEGAFPATDVIVQPAAGREKKLLVADMDSTMITVECIDELADYAGIKAQIAEVTERAMRGELDFAEALDARVALLKGLEESAIDRCLAERVKLMPGARRSSRRCARGARRRSSSRAGSPGSPSRWGPRSASTG